MGLVYEQTREEGLLDQYYRLRQQCYRQELKLSGFDGSEQPADRDGYILIARRGEDCLGGARISVSNSEKSIGVPLKGLLSRFGLAHGNFCIWERFALDHEMRKVERHRQFCEALVGLSRSLGYDYAFMVSSVRNARFYRKVHSALNLPFVTLYSVPCAPSGPFEGLEHVLSVSLLSADSVATEVATATQHYAGVAA